jgi:hypothetical protein
MIKESLIVTTILFISYFVYVSGFAPSLWRGSGNINQIRSIKVENFLYDTDISNKNVILGTSLTNTLISDSIKNTYNLGLHGLSVFDGLYILSLKKEIPKYLFVEMNFITKEYNSSFQNQFSNPSLFIKKNIISLRDEKQPLVIFGNFLENRIISKKIKSTINLNVQSFFKEKLIFDELMANQKKIYSIAPSDSILAEKLNNLSLELKKYEIKGTKIVFFEVPNNTMFTNLPFCKSVRNGFYNKFPKSKYEYIYLPENMNIKTSDGLHLTNEEAESYSSYLRKKIELLQL